jgi:hypothetical protein
LGAVLALAAIMAATVLTVSFSSSSPWKRPISSS